MRFHYILRGVFKPEGGVWSVCKKIRGQIRNLRDLGVDVTLHQYQEIWDSVSPDNQKDIPVFLRKNRVFLLYSKMKREYLVNRELSALIKRSGKEDVVYFRYPVPSFTLMNILRRPRTCRVVLEYQSIEPPEWKVRGEWILLIVDRIFGGLIRRHTDAIVGVTREITAYELKRSGDPGKKHITIGNGFDVRSVSPRRRPEFTPEVLSIICVSQVNRWHGIDRIIEGIAAYQGPSAIYLHIVGTGLEIPALKSSVEKYGLEDRIFFHGYLSGHQLDELFDHCHIAAGSLGLHRIGLEEASILKVREYCSRGIPFFISCADPDFPGDSVFSLTIPGDETPVPVEDLLQFASGICAKPEHPQLMHDYALKNLDWSKKMKVLRDFLDELVNSGL